MHDVTLKFDDNGRGAFFIDEYNQKVAEMVVSIQGDNLTVFHTEVAEKLKGKGVASRLLNAMVTYAREHKKKVIPLCVYVKAQFERNPEKYADIWNKSWHK